MSTVKDVLEEFNKEYKNLFGIQVQFTKQIVKSKRFDDKLKIIKYLYEKNHTEKNAASSKYLYEQLEIYPNNILDYSSISPLVCDVLYQKQGKNLRDLEWYLNMENAGKYIDFMERFQNAMRGAN
jgi:hypothetical protein